MPLPRLEIHAAEHDRRDCPVRVELPPERGATTPALVDEVSGARLPAQRLGDELCFILDRLERGARRTFRLEAGAADGGGVSLVERDGAFEIATLGAPFTTYHFGPALVRPYFFPVFGPTGVAMTRGFPMVDGVVGESTDHPHHRSLYVAFGEVNGVDVWAEPPHPNTGRIVHVGWESTVAGPSVAALDERLRWVDGVGHPLLEEARRIVVHATRDVRLLDLDVELRPSRVAVLFGDTKEGGPLALRVASTMEGARVGLIQNAYGGRRERETWGKRSPWVDYSGDIGGETVGVAIMDHPSSFRHPTWWHVRDYGLFAANPFGTSAFTGDPTQRGDYVLAPGQSLTFRYRICLHRGDADSGEVGGYYHDYANPPVARWV
jgi:hypothetical protein